MNCEELYIKLLSDIMEIVKEVESNGTHDLSAVRKLIPYTYSDYQSKKFWISCIMASSDSPLEVIKYYGNFEDLSDDIEKKLDNLIKEILVL